MTDGGAADGPHGCPFDEDYHAWVHGSTAYVRGYRVDATCGECESELNARYEEHMIVLECSECTVGPIDEVDEWRTRPEPVTWYVSVPNTADLTTWSFYLTGESAAVEAVPHGISVSDSFTEDGDEYELHVALPEEGTDRDLATDGGVDQDERPPPHIEVDGGPDRDVYLNGERLDHIDGGLHHIQLQRDLGEKTAQFTIGYDNRITASVEIFELPKPDPVENVSLERIEDADRVTFRGVVTGEEMLLELVKRGESA